MSHLNCFMVWRYFKILRHSLLPIRPCYITHDSYCSFAVKTQVPEPLQQKHDLMVLRSEDQNVYSLLGDIRIVYISQSFGRCGNKDCKKHKKTVLIAVYLKHSELFYLSGKQKVESADLNSFRRTDTYTPTRARGSSARRGSGSLFLPSALYFCPGPPPT